MTNWTDIASAIVKLTEAGIDPAEIAGLLELTELEPQRELTELEPQREQLGYRIVVLQRGWVVVGNVSRQWDEYTIEDARVIRYWGTKKGLGELVDGPLEKTILDDAGTVRANVVGVVLTIDVKAEKWAR